MLDIFKKVDDVRDYIEEIQLIFKVLVAESMGWEEGDIEVAVDDIDHIFILHKSTGDEWNLTTIEFARFLKYGEEGLE